jgi:phage terminase large subunit
VSSSSSLSATEAARRLIQKWEPNPSLFGAEALGARLWSQQKRILTALAKPGARVAVRSGHKVSKTHTAAVALHWFAQTHRRGRAIFTGPTYGNLVKVLWPEVRRIYRESKFPLGGRLYDDVSKGLQLPGDREVFGLTVKDPEAFAGLSGDILFVVDEGSGVSEAIFDAIFGNTAGGARVLVIGNPTRVSGTFYDAFHSKRAAWTTIHVDSRTTPNFPRGFFDTEGVSLDDLARLPPVPESQRIPGLATPEWVVWAAEQWGVGTPQWDVRVCGNFPTQGDDSVIPLAFVEDAKLRFARMEEDERKPTGPLRIGVDVARFGDDETVIRPLRGDVALPATVLHHQDTVQVAGEVLRIAAELREYGEEPPKVKVDATGLGAGVVDQLVRHTSSVRVYAVDAGSSPTMQPEHGAGYSRLRDQLWFAARLWLRDRGHLPEEPKLEAELVAPCYRFDETGRIKVERKEETKKRLRRSPDRADALNLAIYDPPEVIVLPSRVDSGRRKMASTGGF